LEFSLKPKSVLKLMLFVILLLTIMHISQLVAYYQIGDSDQFDFIKMIDFDYEANLPSLYSSLAIFFCALLLWIISREKIRSHAVFKYHWLGLAVIFTFLGIDEAVALHEEVGDFVEDQEWFEAKGFLYFAWVVPYGILLLIFLISYLKFVFSLPRSIMLKFIGAGTLFVSGAVGLEIISAQEADLHGTETILYSILYTVEELFEMISIVIFCNALLNYIGCEKGTIIFRISTEPDSGQTL